jgi:putative transposase
MPRKNRTKSITGIYHIIVRGINRQNIFNCDEDFQIYLEILEMTKKISKFELYGYCLMNNHVHLLIHENKESISNIMKRLGARYAYYYNNHYDRVGHVFQDRFKSENVEDYTYLLSVIKYIHNNPVKALMVEKAQEYKWSSYKPYLGFVEYPCKLTNTEFILEIFSQNKNVAIEKFKSHMLDGTDELFVECKSIIKKTDKELREEIEILINSNYTNTLNTIDKEELKEIIRKIKNLKGVTQRQIARVLGVSQNMVFTA